MRRARSVVAAVLALGIAVAFGALAGCAHSPTDKARQYGTGLADGGLGVAKFVATLNEQKESEVEAMAPIDAAKAKQMRTEWRHVYDALDKAVKTFGAGVSGLRAAIEIAAASGKGIDFGKVLAEGAKMWADLQAAFNAYGIKLPGAGVI